MPDACWPDGFFLRPTVEIARVLLGALLIRDLPNGQLIGRIVETEAYLQDDPACHGVRELADGLTIHTRTRRNATMFGPPGRAYVYFTYGNHFMLNVVTQAEGTPEAVLIRAIEPLHGLELMVQHRGGRSGYSLTNGPGKLTKALAIDSTLDGHDLYLPPLRLLPNTPVPEAHITATTRIGITKAADKPWRFYEQGNPWISRK